jgi:hypothetical protein
LKRFANGVVGGLLPCGLLGLRGIGAAKAGGRL